MSENLIVTWKKGALGKFVEFNDLRDDNGTVNLDPYSLTLNVVAKDGTHVVTNEPVFKRDQVTREGDAYLRLTSGLAALDVGTYSGELKVTDGVNIDYWPTDRHGNRTYFTIIVQEALG